MVQRLPGASFTAPNGTRPTTLPHSHSSAHLPSHHDPVPRPNSVEWSHGRDDDLLLPSWCSSIGSPKERYGGCNGGISAPREVDRAASGAGRNKRLFVPQRKLFPLSPENIPPLTQMKIIIVTRKMSRRQRSPAGAHMNPPLRTGTCLATVRCIASLGLQFFPECSRRDDS